MRFIGLDSETYRGKAVLLCTPEDYLCWPHSFRQIVEWLSSQGNSYCCFNLDYDARAILRFLTHKQLEDLDFFGWIPADPRTGAYIKYIPAKLLQIGNLRIYDCFQFYRKSLDAVAEEILGERKIHIPQTWLKDFRRAMNTRNIAKAIAYCKRDALLCERLFAHLQKQCEALNVDFSNPVSAGGLALRTFKHHLVGKTPCFSLQENSICQQAYYGGRIEVLQRGHFKNVESWDINSAYPYALSTFHDPRKCEKRRVTRYHKDCVYGLYRASVDIPIGLTIAPIPVPYEHEYFYPVGQFYAWLDKYTMELALPYVKNITVAWEWYPSRGSYPWFTEMQELYRMRSVRPELSLAIKLIMNAIYGKTAEQVRRNMLAKAVYSDSFYHRGEWFNEMRWPARHANFLVAAHITGLTRLQLWQAMHTIGPAKIIACHTDGLYTLPARSLHSSTALGGWKRDKICSDLVMIGSGIYAFKEAGSDKWVNRVRGYSSRFNIVESLRHNTHRAVIPLSLSRVPTLRESVRSNELNSLNQFQTITRMLDVNFDKKREWDRNFKTAESVLKERHRSIPVIVG